MNSEAQDGIEAFVRSFYDELPKGNVQKIRSFFQNEVGEEYIHWSVNASRIYRVERLEIVEINVIEDEPLTVMVDVKKWFKAEPKRPPYVETYFILTSDAEGELRITRIGVPGE